MNNLELLKVAEQLIKNLQWLEVGNPLLTKDELLTFGVSYSERMREQYETVKDFWRNDCGHIKTLSAMMRYVLDRQLELVCSLYKPPYIEPQDGTSESKLRKVQILSGVEYSDLSLAMPRGRSKELGGGSRRKSRTA